MFLSISVDGPGAENLSHIIQKHPEKVFKRGGLQLFFTKYEKERSSVVTMMVPEHKPWKEGNTPPEIISDRDFALSSKFCHKLKGVFNSAIKGNYEDLTDKNMAYTAMELVIDALPFTTSLTDEQIRGLFKSLGYHGFTPAYNVDHSYQHPWMPQKHRVLEVAIRGQKTVREVLRHLLVLIPVIDEEVPNNDLGDATKELKSHSDWLDKHPMRDFITDRFLRTHH